MKRRISAFRLGCTAKVYHNWASYMRGETDSQHLRALRKAFGARHRTLRGPLATVCEKKVSVWVHAFRTVDSKRQFAGRKCRPASTLAEPWTSGDSSQAKSVAPRSRRTSRRPMKKAPPKRGLACREEPASSYWMRVRQYGHTFQSALSGRWQVGQTFLTCVLQIGQTTKSRSMGAPHLGQMP